MKKYIKILVITLGIQLGCVVIGMLLTNMPGLRESLAPVGAVLMLVCFPVSIVVDIVLAIKWGDSIPKKLIYIFFMPTNYTWLMFLLFALWHMGQWMDILSNLSPNFG